MIYLVTGTPGAGKSLYAVSTLVRELVERVLVRRGKTVTRRLCVDGVTGLVIPHEKLAEGVQGDDGSLHPGEGSGIWNWFEWCQPGDVIFVDEVQRWFRPRGMGAKVPPEIKHLETHRHMGVDFVFVTQNPMLMDQNVRRLVYRHQHIRRLWGMQRAVIYEWDGCAENVKSTKAATMRQWNYPRSAYDLYQSSELHTKPKVKLPVWALLPVLALVGLLAVAPKAFSTMKGAMSGQGVTPSLAGAARPPSVPASAPLAAAPVVPPSLPAAVGVGVGFASDAPKVAGCVIGPTRQCSCFDVQGGRVDMVPDMCAALDRPGGKPAESIALSEAPRSRELLPEEVDLYQFIAKQRGPAR